MKDDFAPKSPKPYIFVLMPFESKFNDIYKFGIKGSAQDAGAYVERIDEQIFIEGMLDRLFNQIGKADVIVADMTGRNPNVFYEVGYAHALNKIVLLLAQNANDIPFDLKHDQHIVYSGSIETLKRELTKKLKRAIAESAVKRDGTPQSDFIDFVLDGFRLHSAPLGVNGLTIKIARRLEESDIVNLKVEINNRMLRDSPPLESAYIYNNANTFLRPIGRFPDRTIHPFDSVIVDTQESPDGLFLRHKLDWKIPSLPKGTTHSLRLNFSKEEMALFKEEIPMRIRLQFSNSHFDYPFILDTGGDVVHDILSQPDYQIVLEGFRLHSAPLGISGPTIRILQDVTDKTEIITLQVEFNNRMSRNPLPIKSVYLYCRTDTFLTPIGKCSDHTHRTLVSEIVNNRETSDGLTLRHKLDWEVPSLPKGATHSLRLRFSKDQQRASLKFKEDIHMRVRLHFSNSYYDYPFILDYIQR